MPLRLSSCSLYRYSLSSGRVRYLLWVSCLSLVVVLCFSDSFFTLCVSLLFFASLTHIASSLRLLSVVIPFGPPEVSFLLFDVSSGLLYLLYPPLPFLLLRLLSPAPVPGFRFPFLVVMCCFRVRQRLYFLHSLWFLPSFVSFCLPDCLSLHSDLPLLVSSWCSIFVVFASVSSSFSPVRLLRLEFQTPYSLVGCSDFAVGRCTILDIGFAFSFHCFSSLSAFLQEFPLPFASIFLAYPSFCFAGLCVVTCSSLFFLSPFGLFALASELRCLPCVSLLRSTFLVGFLSFPSFCLLFFHL